MITISIQHFKNVEYLLKMYSYYFLNFNNNCITKNNYFLKYMLLMLYNNPYIYENYLQIISKNDLFKVPFNFKYLYSVLLVQIYRLDQWFPIF